jgi:hypothetical protein
VSETKKIMGDKKENVYSVDQFTGENFRQWRFRIKCALRAKGIDVNLPKPERDDKDYAAWLKQDGMAMYIMTSAMDFKQISLVENCETALQMLQKLESVYEQKSELNKMVLHERFYQYKMSPCDSIAEHISKVEGLAKQLREIDEEISDTAFMTKILSSLPLKYRMVRQAWMSLDPLKQTIPNLTARLLDEEAALTSQENHNDESALFTSNRNKRRPTPEKKRVICYSCHKRGHYAKDCYSKNKVNKHKGNTSNNSAVAFNTEEFANVNDEDIWILDSGASAHMSFRRDFFTNFIEYNSNDKYVKLGDHKCLQVKGKGNIYIKKINMYGEWEENIVEDVLYIPQLKKNLFSEGVLTYKGFKIIKEDSKALIYKNNIVVLKAFRTENNIYELQMKSVNHDENECNVAHHKNNLQKWHERLGHLNVNEILKMNNANNMFNTNSAEKNFTCEACIYGKQCKFTYNKSLRNGQLTPGHLVYSDVCGPMSQSSVQRAKYFVLFKDAASSYRYVYFIKHKSDVINYFKEFDAIVKNKFGHHVRILHTDNGTEYVNGEFKEYMKKYGIEHECSAPYTPEQNGRAERELRTIVESARSMLYARDVPIYLWAEAINCAVYLLNRTTSSQTPNKSPHEIWTGDKPDLKHVRTFGCTGYVHIPNQLRTKFNKKSKNLILVGYQGNTNNYRMYDLQSKRVTISRNVVFNENNTPSIRRNFAQIQIDTDSSNTQDEDIYEDQQVDNIKVSDDSEKEQQIQEEIISEEQSEDQHTENVRINEDSEGENLFDNNIPPEGYSLRNRENIKVPKRYELNLVEFNIPKSYQEAINGPDAESWQQAIHDELQSHKKNNTWSIVDLPDDKKPISSKWVFKIKKSPNNEPERYKARLCARGFSQVKDVDYFETFAPTTRYDSIRILLSIAAHKNYKILQFDVKTAFLYGELDEDIYMEIPEGIDFPNTKNQACKLNKSLYGLKQAARVWNKTFTEFLKTYGFLQCYTDNCVFVSVYNNVKVLLILYVDDALIMSECNITLESILKELKQKFDIKVCKPNNFVGLSIENTSDYIRISQTNYINEIIQRFNLSDAKPASTPSDINVVLKENNSEELIAFPYREAVGSLLFLSTVSRPDISYAVNVASRFINNYNSEHVNAVKRIIRYLIKTKHYGIEYTRSKFSINGFSDSDFAGDVDSRRSTTGYLFIINEGPVTWASHRQKTVALSTTEAEYMAACDASKEILWIKQFLSDIGEPIDSIILSIDNQSAIKLIKNPVFHNRSKHIDIKYKFIRDNVETGNIVIEYCPSEFQLADILTKSLPVNRFDFICNKILN